MTTFTTVYTLGGELPDLDLFWDDDGELIDFSESGWAFSVSMYPYNGATLFTKSSGFAGAAGDLESDPPEPNLVVSWTNTDLGSVTQPGRYTLHFKANTGIDTIETFGELIIRPPVASRGYCEVPDLPLGGVTLDSKTNPTDYINSAADEINARIGQLYTLPLDLLAAEGFVAPLLRSINARLAAGRLLCTKAEGSDKVHAYGAQLIKEATADINAIVCGSTQLIGVPKLPGSFKVTAPSIVNQDDFSATTAFENFALRNDPDEYWYPGTTLQPGKVI